MIGDLDHVAIVVNRIEDRLPFYRDVLGLVLKGVEEVPGEKVRVALLGHGPGRVELVEPRGEGSPVERFLKERGEGIHHICFLVDSIDEACARLKASGVELTGGVRRGSEGTRIGFVHPRTSGGVLIELREKAGTDGEATESHDAD